jgi:hypothetical protein
LHICVCNSSLVKAGEKDSVTKLSYKNCASLKSVLCGTKTLIKECFLVVGGGTGWGTLKSNLNCNLSELETVRVKFGLL